MIRETVAQVRENMYIEDPYQGDHFLIVLSVVAIKLMALANC